MQLVAKILILLFWSLSIWYFKTYTVFFIYYFVYIILYSEYNAAKTLVCLR